MTPRTHHRTFSPDDHGELIYHDQFRSHVLGNDRPLVVYLPPGYEADADTRYPVLYMQDGQNLFDGRTSFIRGQHWHLGETADNLIREGAVEPLIIVGIYHAGERRIAEYTPTADPNFNVGGRAELYGRMLAEELKSFIDDAYRTKPGREHTGVGGSSLGGLISLHLGFNQPDLFSRVVAMSPSLWWGRCWFLRRLENLTRVPEVKVWLDAGTCEGRNTACHAESLRDVLVARGMTPDRDVSFMRAEGGRHSEQDWAHRAHHALRFLYPAKESEEKHSPQPIPASCLADRLFAATGHETLINV